jgi:hypothetical protein
MADMLYFGCSQSKATKTMNLSGLSSSGLGGEEGMWDRKKMTRIPLG